MAVIKQSNHSQNTPLVPSAGKGVLMLVPDWLRQGFA